MAKRPEMRAIRCGYHLDQSSPTLATWMAACSALSRPGTLARVRRSLQMTVLDLVAAVLGSSVVGGIVTWLSNRKLIAAQTRQLEAATEHQRVQTDAIRQQADVTQQRTDSHANQLGTLHLVVAHMLSTHEQFFLKQLEANTDYAFEDKFREKDHLRRLRDLAFVSKKGDRHIA